MFRTKCTELRAEKSSLGGSPKLTDFYRLDYRTGAVINEVTEGRVQLVPAGTWKVLRARLFLDFEERGPLAMFEIGFTLGSSFADEMMKHISDPVVLVRRLTDMAAAAGWGILSVVGDLQYGSQLTITAANCVFCDNQDMSTSPQCDFLVGTVKGILDRVYGAPHKVWEERCAAMGDSACQTYAEESTEELMKPDFPASRSLVNARLGLLAKVLEPSSTTLVAPVRPSPPVRALLQFFADRTPPPLFITTMKPSSPILRAHARTRARESESKK